MNYQTIKLTTHPTPTTLPSEITPAVRSYYLPDTMPQGKCNHRTTISKITPHLATNIDRLVVQAESTTLRYDLVKLSVNCSIQLAIPCTHPEVKVRSMSSLHKPNEILVIVRMALAPHRARRPRSPMIRDRIRHIHLVPRIQQRA